MPNWTNNTLNILVHKDNREALLADLAGPGDWHAPNGEDINENMFRKAAKLSAHEEIALADYMRKPQKELELAFRTDPINAAWPTWMPIGKGDIGWYAKYALFGTKPDLSAYRTVPFSVAKLAPWRDKAEQNTLFPGQIEADGWWAENPHSKRNYNSGDSGYIALRREKIGTKWPPSEVEIVTDGSDDRNDNALIVITYQTPWSPIDNINALVWNVLTKHNAKMLCTWEEEDQNSGWFLADPATDRDESQVYNHGAFGKETVDEDFPEETYHAWDHDAFITAVINDINDTDFEGIG